MNRERAAVLVEEVQEKILTTVAIYEPTHLKTLKRELVHDLSEEQEQVLPLAIYNLLNQGKLHLSASRELRRTRLNL